ncbi:MAG: hypothetical protein JOZ27_06335 [Caulobacteraceae bacterium]|nr:hypothetical protein [Caulobacteraceae bacterium]
MRPFAVLGQRVRGFRVVDLAALTVLLAVALGSYAMKTLAEANGVGERDTQAEIAQEQRRIRLLRAEISHLEAPARLERLALGLGMAPPDPKREIAPADIDRVLGPPAGVSR